MGLGCVSLKQNTALWVFPLESVCSCAPAQVGVDDRRPQCEGALQNESGVYNLCMILAQNVSIWSRDACMPFLFAYICSN